MAARLQPAAGNVAESLIRGTGARLTVARVRILHILLNAGRALTHGEVEDALGHDRSIDRVTVYRVLDWLTEIGLAHRITDSHRVWRFNAAADGRSDRHAHFTCTSCTRTICLDDGPELPALPLPAGFHPQHIDVTVRGLCDECTHDNSHDSAPHRDARKQKMR